MRLDKYLSASGFGTRSEVKKYIKAGRVLVNDKTAKDSGENINESEDTVLFDGEKVEYSEYHYIMLNKPKGYVCSADEKGQKTVPELINEPYRDKLFSVGRLDKDTTGLLLLTDDGALSHRLLSPRTHMDKEYEIVSGEPVTDKMIKAFEDGLDIGDDKKTLPAKLFVTKDEYHSNVILHEGRFHQIKRMFEACDNEVLELNRIRMKNLVLDNNLGLSEYRVLTDEEIAALKE